MSTRPALYPAPHSEPDRTLSFESATCRLWFRPPGHVQTTFVDGATVDGAPEDTPAYRATASALGYPDAMALNLAHDPLHLLVGQCLAFGSRHPQYPVLRAVAAGAFLPDWQAEGEESIVLALARWLNDGTPSPWLAPLLLAGWSLEELRERAQPILDRTPPPPPQEESA